MSLHAHSPAGQPRSEHPPAAATPAAASPRRTRLARLRRGSLAVLVLVVAEYVLGMYVNLYVAVPRADHGHGVGTAIASGPAVLSTHAVLGLLISLAALAVLVNAILARRPAVIACSALGLVALALAAAAGSSFASSGHAEDSMAMSVLTGVALLCYAASLWLAPGRADAG